MAENPVVRALAARVRGDGSAPLLTWYGAAGARSELSVKTFANWVDKTANLLAELDVEGQVAGPLSLVHPGHWMSLVWPLAAWQRGCAYVAGAPDAETTLVVVGPDDQRPHPGLVTIACSLHPLGLGLRGLPDGVLDYSTEALAQPDAHWAEPVDPSALAWQDDERELTHDDLAAARARTLSVRVRSERVLVRPSTPWRTLAEAVVGPLLGGGSAVVVDTSADAGALAALAAAERVTGTVA